MNKKYILLSLIPFLLPACQNLIQHNPVHKTMNNQKNLVEIKTITTDYYWSYQTNKNLPEVLINFDKKQNFSISTGCNQQGGTWQLLGQVMTTSALRSTMMMCSPQLMQQEKQSSDLFNQSQLTLQVSHDATHIPQLHIIDKNGKEYFLKGKIKPEAQYQSEADIIFLDISPVTQTCSTTPNAQCLQVKELKYNDQGIPSYIDQNWKILPIQIQGYYHDPKIKKTIRVKRFQTNATAAPQYAYIYDMTVQQEILNP